MPDSPVIATLHRARRVWAIASIHGEADRFRRVRAEIGRRLEPGDRVVFLGNVLGRGQKVRETLDAVLAFRSAVIARHNALVSDVALLRGAQEEMWQRLLQLQFAVNPGEVLDWMLEQGVGATIEAYGGSVDEARHATRQGTLAVTRWTQRLREAFRQAGHQDWLSALKHAALTRGGELLFVSRGIAPERPLDAQADVFWWGSRNFDGIDAPYGDFLRVVRGFDPAHGGVRDSRFTLTLDAGCGFDGPLIAGCIGIDGKLADLVEG